MPSLDTAGHIVSGEAISVVFAAALVWLSVMVQHMGNTLLRGTAYVIGDRSVPPPQEGFFGRSTRTLVNNVESALMYVPSVVVILVLHRTTWASQLAAETYIGTRALYTLSYWLKIPLVRSAAWFVGMICSAAVAVLAVGSLA